MGRALVLEVLTLYPEKEPKRDSRLCNEGRDMSGSVKVRRISSTKSERLYSLCHISISQIATCQHFLKGSPWFIEMHVPVNDPDQCLSLVI